jgi:zinc/manganese transport system substrate-binding protein
MASIRSEEPEMVRSICRLAGLLVLLGSLTFATGAHALEVFACEPEWASLAVELGGDTVRASSATTARQDPHQIQARPSLIALVRTADLVVCTGAGLEAGWLPLLLRQAANPRVQPGSPGYFEAARQVRLLDIPTQLDRGLGDIHPAGNPHIQTDPRNIASVAAALAIRMQQLNPANAATIASRAQNFQARWAAALQLWTQQAAGLRGTPIAAYHKNWTYLEDWLGLREVATIEPKPGIPPGSQYLAQLISELPAKGVRGVIYAAYEDPRAAQFIAGHINVPAIVLPHTVGATDRASDLFGLFEDMIDRLMRGLTGSASAQR